ncbi:AbrB/MazE/SpoVT family DNA-binding domain-containing protein [Candidatus Dependentiae bacterium]|nr:AbrB/MazE/SpoVT family DNA-binding domain-containing protein [Candidatus Dependentiae bacterium]
MVKKLSKYGNSLALIIDKPILDLLNITAQTVLEITTDGTNITIRPVKKGKKRDDKDQKIMKAVKKIMDRYADDLQKLADE